MRPIKLIASWIVNAKLKKEFDNQKIKRLNERPIEFAFVFSKLREHYPSRLLDVGPGTTALPHMLRNCGMHVTAIDNIEDYWPAGMFNRHYYVINDDILNPKTKGNFDMIFCISTLEHIKNAALALENMSRLLDDGGLLVLTFPSSPMPYIENCYDLADSSYGKGNPYVAQSFSADQIEDWQNLFGLVEVGSEYWKCWTGDYWTCGHQVCPPQQVGPTGAYNLRCVCLRKAG